MLTRDPLVLRALGSLSDRALGSLDGLIEQGTFFQSAEPLMWHGPALLQFRVDAQTGDSTWECSLFSPGLPPDLHATPRARRLLFTFELRAPSFFQALLQPGEQHLRAFGVTLQPGTLPRVALIEEDTVVWRIGSPLPAEPLSVTHLFAGAFHGWGQALECISRSLGLEVAHEVLVDNSPIVVSARRPPWTLRRCSCNGCPAGSPPCACGCPGRCWRHFASPHRSLDWLPRGHGLSSLSPLVSSLLPGWPGRSRRRLLPGDHVVGSACCFLGTVDGVCGRSPCAPPLPHHPGLHPMGWIHCGWWAGPFDFVMCAPVDWGSHPLSTGGWPALFHTPS